jgi:hypothetical protein
MFISLVYSNSPARSVLFQAETSMRVSQYEHMHVIELALNSINNPQHFSPCLLTLRYIKIYAFVVESTTISKPESASVLQTIPSAPVVLSSGTFPGELRCGVQRAWEERLPGSSAFQRETKHSHHIGMPSNQDRQRHRIRASLQKC